MGYGSGTLILDRKEQKHTRLRVYVLPSNGHRVFKFDPGLGFSVWWLYLQSRRRATSADIQHSFFNFVSFHRGLWFYQLGEQEIQYR